MAVWTTSDALSIAIITLFGAVVAGLSGPRSEILPRA
jgi:hypothetical protein